MKIKMSRILLSSVYVSVFFGWLIQFFFHQTWRYLPFVYKLPWWLGSLLAFAISAVPLLVAVTALRRSNNIAINEFDNRDIGVVLGAVLVGVVYWWIFASDAIHYPIHTYGDESFHFNRVGIMVADVKSWIRFVFGESEPVPPAVAQYMFYPSLAYVPITIVTSILGDASSVTNGRIALVPEYLAVVIATYIFSRLYFRNKKMSVLLALVPLSSALLISYTMSFYIEIHYVSILIIAFWLLALGIRKDSSELVLAAVLVSSLAPIIRESAFPTAVALAGSAAVWKYKVANKSGRVMRLSSSLTYVFLGILPFLIYYIAKSTYTDWDRARTSLAYLLQQDYFALFLYSFVYLGPLVVVCVFFSIRLLNTYPYVVGAALASLVGELLIQSVFAPGYMPWSRNYLTFFAPSLVLTVISLDWIWRERTALKKAVLIAILLGISTNVVVATAYLHDDQIFHESETIYNYQPIANFIGAHATQFINETIYTHTYQPTFSPDPKDVFTTGVKFESISALSEKKYFIDFATLRQSLPPDTRYVLFHWFRNSSRPAVFHHLPTAERPAGDVLGNYRMIVESLDPWSDGRSGVMLLEKKSN